MTDRRSVFAAAALGLFFAGFMLATAFQQREGIVALVLGAVGFITVIGVTRMLWESGYRAGQRRGFDHALLLWKEHGNLDTAWAAKEERERRGESDDR